MLRNLMFSSSISNMVAVENKTYKAVPCVKSLMQNKKFESFSDIFYFISVGNCILFVLH